MRAKRRRRKRRMEFTRSWILVGIFLFLLTSSVFLYLESENSLEPLDGIGTVEVYTIQAENTKAEESAAELPQVTVEVTVQVTTIDLIPLGAEDTYISDEIQLLCAEIGKQTGYCPEFLMAIIEAESSGRQYAENGSCKGLMQINTDWPEIAVYMNSHGYTDVYDYETNIRLGCYVLDQKREIYGDDIYAVLMGYNGSSNVMERVENGDYTDYAVGIVDRAWELERLHGK